MRQVVRDRRILQSHHISTTFFSMIENTPPPLGSIKCFEATIFDDVSLLWCFPKEEEEEEEEEAISQKSFEGGVENFSRSRRVEERGESFLKTTVVVGWGTPHFCAQSIVMSRVGEREELCQKKTKEREREKERHKSFSKP